MRKSKFDSQKPFDNSQGRHHRRSIRVKGFDYSSEGAYYVTIVTYHRDCLFGKIEKEEMILYDYGKIADECWRAIPNHFPFVELGAYVVMPNHVHGIILIINDDRADAIASARRGTIYRDNEVPHVGARHASPLRKQPRGVLPNSLGAIIGSFKSAVTKRIGRELNATGIWQRNYYEHIIRDEKDLQNKTDYIEANPSLWDEDENNPINPLP
jgi:REP element-mobilizing transposase RayT